MAVDTRERDVRQLARARALMAEGMPYQQASEAAAWEEIQAMRAANPAPRGPDGRIVLDDDEAAFDARMADAMGQGNLEAAASSFDIEPTVMPKPVGRRAPGPVDSRGRSEAGSDIYLPKELEGYELRKPIALASDEEIEAAMAEPGGLYRSGAELPSQEDRDMHARGMVSTYNPRTGQYGYSVAYPQAAFGQGVPLGAPGRLGSRPDLVAPVVDTRTGRPIPGTHKYEKSLADTPFGQHEVYLPSNEFRQQLTAREEALRKERLARAAGVSNADAAGMDLDQLRAAGRAERADARDVRMAEVTRRAMERQNPTALLNDEWRQYVNASRLLGRPAGASPNDIAARNLETATQLAAGAVRGAIQGQGLTAQEAALNERTRQERRAATDPLDLARGAVAAGEFNSSDVLNIANRIIDDTYSSDFLGVMSTDFDDEEVALAAGDLHAQTGMPEAEALRLMQRLQGERRRRSRARNPLSGATSWF